MMNTTVFQAIVHYSGRVQGVGFRYRVRQIACEFEVTGYVHNLADGRVLLEAEGEESEVLKFLAEVRDQLSVFIRDVESQHSLHEARFKDFVIK